MTSIACLLFLSAGPLVAAASPIHFACSGTTGSTGSQAFCESGFFWIERRNWDVRVVASAGPTAAGYIHGAVSSVTFDCFPTLGVLGSACDSGAGPAVTPGSYRLVAEFDVVTCAQVCQWGVTVDLTPI